MDNKKLTLLKKNTDFTEEEKNLKLDLEEVDCRYKSCIKVISEIQNSNPKSTYNNKQCNEYVQEVILSLFFMKIQNVFLNYMGVEDTLALLEALNKDSEE